MPGETSAFPIPPPKRSRYRVWGVLVAVLGLILLVYGGELLLQMQGESLVAALPIPPPSPEFLDMYWESLPTLGWGLIIAGLALIFAGVIVYRKGSAEATPIEIP